MIYIYTYLHTIITLNYKLSVYINIVVVLKITFIWFFLRKYLLIYTFMNIDIIQYHEWPWLFFFKRNPAYYNIGSMGVFLKH